MHNESKNLLKKYDLRPNKRLGQNFLVNEAIVQKLIEAAEVTEEDTVVEAGPGTGTITKELAQLANRVIAIEKDARLIPLLQEELKNLKNVEIVQDDILQFNPKTYNLQPTTYNLVGAPPYYLTARLFRHFLEEVEQKPSLIAVIIQREVAQKIIAKPPRSNLLALSVQLYGEPKIERVVSKGSFWPSPKVDSALLVVRNIKAPDLLGSPGLPRRSSPSAERAFFTLIRAGFSSPRKQLATNLAKKFELPREEIEKTFEKAGVDPTRRAETLSLQEWKAILNCLAD